MKILKSRQDLEDSYSQNLDIKLLHKAYEIMKILDDSYGENRDINVDHGGYILIVESQEDLAELVQHTGYNSLDDHIFEFVDRFNWGYHALVLKSAEFAISVLFKMDSLSEREKTILESFEDIGNLTIELLR